MDKITRSIAQTLLNRCDCISYQFVIDHLEPRTEQPITLEGEEYLDRERKRAPMGLHLFSSELDFRLPNLYYKFKVLRCRGKEKKGGICDIMNGKKRVLVLVHPVKNYTVEKYSCTNIPPPGI